MSDVRSAQQFDRLRFAFHASTKETPYHTVEVWPQEEAESNWAKMHPGERQHWYGSSLQTSDSPVGSLSWHHKTGEILGLFTSKEYQRQGIATAMLGEARHIAADTGVSEPRHSSTRTESGEAWARSLGENLPERQT